VFPPNGTATRGDGSMEATQPGGVKDGIYWCYLKAGRYRSQGWMNT
jgi:hypothetical protein